MQTTIREVTGTVSKSGPGRALIRIIDAGTGSSGTYTEEVLERAASELAFPRGTQMHLDHDTGTDSMERPEGSLRNLVGVLTEDARYEDGALVAEARVGSNWRTFLEDFGEFIGVSISASAEISETKNGRVIERIIPSPFNRADLVTVAGRGGRVEAVIEAAKAAQEKYSLPNTVRANTNKEEATMATTIEESRLMRLEEASDRVPVLEAEVKQREERIVALETELQAEREARAKEAKERAETERLHRVAEAKRIVTEAFGEDAPALYTRLAESAATPEDFDADAFRTEVQEAAAKAEADKGAGTPRGLGGLGGHVTESKTISDEDIANAL